MKKILYALLVGAMVVAGANYAAACHPETGIGCNDTIVQVPRINTDGTAAEASNGQWQTQGVTAVNLGMNGGITAMNQAQEGTGFSKAQLGSGASENQFQGQNISQTLANPVATHNYDSTTITGGNSAVPAGPGRAFHGEFQTVDAGIGTLSNNAGTASLAGAVMKVDQCVVAGGTKGTNAAAGAANLTHSDYMLSNVGPTSAIYQAGSQDSSFLTGAAQTGGGGAAANLQATQMGGTGAVNNAVGSAMAGGGYATGQVKAENGATRGDVAGSVGGQQQIHSYAQASGGANQSQWANGTVATYNTINSGNLPSGFTVPGSN